MQGHADSPLTAEGRRQAQVAARKLGMFDIIVSSDLKRASDTASIIADELGIGMLPARSGLREINVGPWEGLTRKEIDKRFPRFLDNDMRPPGYEADEDVFARVRASLIEISETHPGSLGLVITHSGIIRVMRRVLGHSDQRNHRNLEGCWFTITADGEVSCAESVNILRNSTTSDTL
jgi:broad specificity phosphatase PhoE